MDKTVLDCNRTKHTVTDKHNLYEIWVLTAASAVAWRGIWICSSRSFQPGNRWFQVPPDIPLFDVYGPFPLTQGHTVHVWDGHILLPLMTGRSWWWWSKFSSLVICTGGGSMLFSYVHVLFIYIWLLYPNVACDLSCYIIDFDLLEPWVWIFCYGNSQKTNEHKIYMVFCIYTTTTLQFRFHHCYCIIRMLMQSFWAKGKFMIMFNYHVSTHLQRYSVTLRHYSAIYYDHIIILLHEYSYRRYVIILVLHYINIACSISLTSLSCKSMACK